MLDETRIERLLMELRKAHKALIDTAEAYEQAKAELSNAETYALANHTFEGKNADARKLEAASVLGRTESVFSAQKNHEAADHNLSIAKMQLEIAREAISLWRALAYQMQPNRDM